MQAWLVWMLVAGGLGIAELAVGTLDLALLAAAALAAAGVGALGFPIGIQFLTFCVTSVLLLVLVRPIARKRMARTPLVRSGTAALVGKEAITLTDVARESGRVRIGGEEWTARPYAAEEVIPKGTICDVFAIEGATALVHPREEPWLR